MKAVLSLFIFICLFPFISCTSSANKGKNESKIQLDTIWNSEDVIHKEFFGAKLGESEFKAIYFMGLIGNLYFETFELPIERDYQLGEEYELEFFQMADFDTDIGNIYTEPIQFLGTKWKSIKCGFNKGDFERIRFNKYFKTKDEALKEFHSIKKYLLDMEYLFTDSKKVATGAIERITAFSKKVNCVLVCFGPTRGGEKHYQVTIGWFYNDEKYDLSDKEYKREYGCLDNFLHY